MKYKSTELAAWSGAEWKNSAGEFFAGGVNHDTRTLNAGDVYVAIRGAVHDGHDFIPAAIEKGAAALITEKEFPADIPQLVVSDSLAALQRLAAGVRKTWKGTVIGITGSVGKTTVKEMIAAVLSQKGLVSKTPGNWNNDIGLPLSMLAANRNSDFFVFELGMNHAGEIAALANILKPDWAALTDIGKAHIEFFGSVEKIAEEKASLLRYAKNVVLDETSEWFSLFKKSAGGARILTFGDAPFPFHLSLPGAHIVRNARRAAALGEALGLTTAEIQRGFDSFTPGSMRWERSEKNGVVFINDAYNANPLSMRAALTAFAELPCAGKKYAVLGAMRELGNSSSAEHRELGTFVDELKFDGVITVGDAGAKIICRSFAGLSHDATADFLRERLTAGDMVFLKASRGEKLEKILERLCFTG